MTKLGTTRNANIVNDSLMIKNDKKNVKYKNQKTSESMMLLVKRFLS